MSAAAVVLVCALDLLGRSADRLPPIEILHTRPAGVSANALAFVDSTAGVIYLIASSTVFSDAMSPQSSPIGCQDPTRCGWWRASSRTSSGISRTVPTKKAPTTHS